MEIFEKNKGKTCEIMVAFLKSGAYTSKSKEIVGTIVDVKDNFVEIETKDGTIYINKNFVISVSFNKKRV